MSDEANRYVPPMALKSSAPTVKPMAQPLPRFVVLVFAMTSALPITFVSMLYAVAIRAAIYLGHWPYYGHPDPKDLPDHFDPSEALEWIIPLAMFLGCAGGLFYLIAYRFPARVRLSVSLIVVSACWFGSIVFFCADPFGVFEWYVD